MNCNICKKNEKTACGLQAVCIHSDWSNWSNGALHLSWTQAACTNMNWLRCTVNDSLNLHDIRFPSSVWSSVWMRNLYTKAYALSTYITFSHYNTSCNSIKQTSFVIVPYFFWFCNRFKRNFFFFFSFFKNIPKRNGFIVELL